MTTATLDAPVAPVSMTERAAGRIKEILADEAPGSKLRVSVLGGGCSGFSYDFGFDVTAQADDLVISRDGATVLIDPVSLPYLAGSEIDFVDELIGASFQIRNPNATASCGCGTSFAI
ncbi:iron-sulfur cluster assembly accessory protein [Methylopila capsulata]|uniref:Heme biosynthesis protein HemY n=1 Tax=Methylopila capsulata TaxID=61654 RepID=A0A9W6MRZ2_9HYPH|nr:iron-sulfur cluster insertion protein ErpA [Methylopila capsulata]MBM7850416.1 iron-sulfur cluster assembly accessory protein [Methylopila capsulata]GLK55709.1 heme biosynthesis protein HemY [Methylopila capsulata]